MKHLKKVSLMLLALAVFSYTSFAIGTNNLHNSTQSIGKFQEIKLISAKDNRLAVKPAVTPVVILVVLLIAAVSTSPAYSGGAQSGVITQKSFL